MEPSSIHSSATSLAFGDLSLSYSYVNETEAFALNLSYISSDDAVIMKGDDTSTLQTGQYRNRCGVTCAIQFHIINVQSVSEFQAMQYIILVFSFWI